jgi:hypothetical protein
VNASSSASTSPRILFLADAAPDYVADGLFHGLRALHGASVVDFPRREAMYASTLDLGRFYGRGFGLYGLLPDLPVDRENVFEREWDLVVTAAIWRDWSYWARAWRAFGSQTSHAVVDGGDLHWMYPYGPAWWRPSRCFVPRAHTRATYFKREWSAITMVAAARRVHLEPIAIAYPQEKVVDSVPVKTEEFAQHIVDLEVGKALGRKLEHDRAHIFAEESTYLADLRVSRFGVTTKRAGWDALRHLEIAAAGAVPCFRHLEDKPVTCAPHGLISGVNCVSYRDAESLLCAVRALSETQRDMLSHGALSWAQANTTVQRAACFLDRAL